MNFASRVAAALSVATLIGSPARAYTILSPVTQGCHERILLGTLGDEETGYNGDGQPSTAQLMAHLTSRIPANQVPSDSATRGMIEEMNNRYGWHGFDLPTQYVLASFIAGVRAPDTDGFSIVNLNNLRSTQINDDSQPSHSLRTKEDDYDTGDQSAIQKARAQITTELNKIVAEWITPGVPTEQERWTFAFYGTQVVTVFSPAYDLGYMIHAVQDSYAHTIRDENFQIVAVSNYLEVMLNAYDQDRDGPAHSDRLDQCNLSDSFDAMRITETRKQSANVLNAVDSVLESGGTDLTPVQSALDTIYSYRSGCNLPNQYCATTWYQQSSSDVTQPYNIGCGSVAPEGPPPPPTNRSTMLLLFILPIAVAFGLRRRAKGARRA